MGRPRKIEKAVSKSIRLPAKVVEKLSYAAELFGQDFCELARNLLEKDADPNGTS